MQSAVHWSHLAEQNPRGKVQHQVSTCGVWSLSVPSLNGTVVLPSPSICPSCMLPCSETSSYYIHITKPTISASNPHPQACVQLYNTCMEHSTMVTATTASCRVTSEWNINLAWAARTSYLFIMLQQSSTKEYLDLPCNSWSLLPDSHIFTC